MAGLALRPGFRLKARSPSIEPPGPGDDTSSGEQSSSCRASTLCEQGFERTATGSCLQGRVGWRAERLGRFPTVLLDPPRRWRGQRRILAAWRFRPRAFRCCPGRFCEACCTKWRFRFRSCRGSAPDRRRRRRAPARNPFPEVFGYHELFHALTIFAVACQYVAIAFFVIRAG